MVNLTFKSLHKILWFKDRIIIRISAQPELVPILKAEKVIKHQASNKHPPRIRAHYQGPKM